MNRRNVTAVLLGAWLTVMLAGSAFAADWRTVAESADSQVFVDRASLTSTAEGTEASVLVTYASQQTLGDWFPHRSRVVRYELRCATGEVRLEGFTFAAGELGSGNTVWSEAPLSRLPAKPAAGTVESAVLAAVCDPAKVSLLDR